MTLFKALFVSLINFTGLFPPGVHCAMANESMILETLRQNGANIEAETDQGKTPLHVAASEGSEKSVERLIQMGANIDAKTFRGLTPLHLAALSGQSLNIKVLLEN